MGDRYITASYLNADAAGAAGAGARAAGRASGAALGYSLLEGAGDARLAWGAAFVLATGLAVDLAYDYAFTLYTVLAIGLVVAAAALHYAPMLHGAASRFAQRRLATSVL